MKKINKRKLQKGISLPISLFVLMGVLISAMLLLRTGDIAVSVAGNIAERSQLNGSNDQTIENAYQWLISNKNSLDNDNKANGYFSSYPSGIVDYTQDDNWKNAKVSQTDSLGNINSYMIIRMCNIPNAARNATVNNVNNVCYTDSGTDAVTSDTSSIGYGAYSFTQQAANLAIIYKIMVKTTGHKGSSLITETIVSI